MLLRFKILYFILLCTLHFNSIFAQNQKEIIKANKLIEQRGEVMFSIQNVELNSIQKLTKIISIQTIEGDSIICFANKKQFNEFITFNIPFKVIQPFSISTTIIQNLKSSLTSFSQYPSYNEYLALMDSFVIKYPDYCRLIDFGSSVKGKKLLAVKISDNPNIDEDEPEFLYTSSMHGNETAGFILMLNLIEYLLENYGTDNQLTNLIDNTEIFINPLFNPDGFYFPNDSILESPKRFNANNIDLNRNFPDPQYGDNPDGYEYQPETQAMMDFMEDRNIILSANLHSGAEVINYPWDTWAKLHADNEWFSYISRQYADTAHKYNNTYLTDLNNGITNGYSWYQITGGRQDYVTFYLRGREVTLEISKTFVADNDLLDSLWKYNKNSLLNYIENCQYGIHGKVIDSITGEPILADIMIEEHDKDQSFVKTNPATGKFYRMIYAGNYLIDISANEYVRKFVPVSILNGETINMEIKFTKYTSGFKVVPNPFVKNINLYLPSNEQVKIKICDLSGKIVYKETRQIDRIPYTMDLNFLNAGIYIAEINAERTNYKIKLCKYSKL